MLIAPTSITRFTQRCKVLQSQKASYPNGAWLAAADCGERVVLLVAHVLVANLHLGIAAFFKPVASGGTVVDMSCGSGLMTRRLVNSGAYARVIALDYSESMLTETARRIEEERVPTDALTLCRADVAALPLATASVDAMHAGAAMHCWPNLEEGLREIRRSLKPGGRLYDE